MKTRDRFNKVRQALGAWRDVRGTLALARRKEAEGVEKRQHPQEPKPSPGKTNTKPSATRSS